jgi:hypothetical protein
VQFVNLVFKISVNSIIGNNKAMVNFRLLLETIVLKKVTICPYV